MKHKPLTKDDRELYPSGRPGFYEEDLISALEEFEEKISRCLDADSCLLLAKMHLRKAFPAIYEEDNLSRSNEVEK